MSRALLTSVARIAPFAVFYFTNCFGAISHLAMNRLRIPVVTSPFVEHCTTDARNAVSFEFDAARHVKGLDGIHQTKDASGDEIVEFHTVG